MCWPFVLEVVSIKKRMGSGVCREGWGALMGITKN